MLRKIRKELAIRPQHVPGDNVAGQELEEFADAKLAGVKVTDQLDRTIGQVAMDGGMFGCPREAGSGENQLLIHEMLDNLMDQRVDDRGYFIRWAPGKGCGQEFVSVSE